MSNSLERNIQDILREARRPNRTRLLTVFSFAIFAFVASLLLQIYIPEIVYFYFFSWFLESFLMFALIDRLKKIEIIKNLSFLQFILDLFLVTILVYYIGVIGWIAPIFYVFTLIYSGFFVTEKERWFLLFLAIFLYDGLLLGEHFKYIPYQNIFDFQFFLNYPPYIWGTFLIVPFVFLGISWSVGIFAERLVERRRELERIKNNLEKMVAEKTQKLEEQKKSLEREVKERTSVLEKRTKDLEETQKALLNILEDVEDARAKLEEERDKTLAIIRNFTDGILVFDKDNILVEINDEAENLLGIRRESLLGKKISEINLKETESLFKMIFDGKEIKKVKREPLSLGKEKVLEVTTVPFFRKEEKEGVFVVLHDITREKMIDKLKTEFVSISAHQLRTPLSAIKWSLRMILDGDMGPLSKEQKEFLEKTYRSNERMINLVNDLLDVTRIEEGRFLYNPVLVDIGDLVSSVVKNYKDMAKRKKVKLIFEKPKNLPQVKVDVEKMKLAITNLIDNALRYTPAGGQVKVATKKKEKELEISVSDTGIGIPKEQQKRIFSRFFRGTNAIRTQTEGTGLGLFITKNIIEAHGGKIWFKSEENKGTIFYFTIPFQLTKIN